MTHDAWEGLPVIHFRHVTFTYPNAEQPALSDINLELPEGELILVIGPSGAGKSTLLRCINGLAPHFSGGVLAGNIRVGEFDPVQATPQVMSRHVGFVFQDPEAQFVMDRVEDEIAFALENAAIAPEEMRVRVEETLDLLDLTPLRDRALSTLSGGERQRVAIAAVLALRPQILVLDEPTSQLDPKSAEDVLAALVRLNTDLGLTILVAEHRLERVLPYVDKILYLPADGSSPLLDEPRAVLAQIDLAPPLVRLGKALGWQPLPLTIKEGLRYSRRQASNGKATVVPQLSPAAAPSERTPFVCARNVHAAYGGVEVLHGLSLDVHPQEIVALMGRNGSGKTTLLKCLVGLVRPVQGEIRVDGRSIVGVDVADICRQVAYLPQDPNALLFAETVNEELAITLHNHDLIAKRSANALIAKRSANALIAKRSGNSLIAKRSSGALPVHARALLEKLGMAGHAESYPRDLSAGERQRAALAAITVTQPRALLLDEPTRGLDYAAKRQLAELLRRWREEGMAIVVVTHDVELAAEIADRVVLMSQGEVIAQGDPAQVLGASPLFAPQVAKLYPNSGWLTVEDALHAA